MRKLIYCLLGILTAVGSVSIAVEPPRKIEREVFVPFADLHLILGADTQRVFMTREEYQSLSAKARKLVQPEADSKPAAILSAEYLATVEEHRAKFTGTLQITVPDEHLTALKLELSGVSLQRATLDDKPAPLGRDGAGVPVLFVAGAGIHTLKLEMFAPLETAAAQRTLSFQIPTPPATRL